VLKGRTRRDDTHKPALEKIFVCAVQVRPSGLVATDAEESDVYPTATQLEPFQDIPCIFPPAKSVVLEDVHIIPSVLVATVTEEPVF
jgi:hypothetical protein